MTPTQIKILYAITKGTFGGAQRYVFDLACAMKEKGFAVSVAVPEEGALKGKLEGEGVRVHPLSTLQRDVSLLRDSASLFGFLRLYKKECPDIIHLNSSKAGFIGALAGRIAGVPKIIFTAHGWAFNENRFFIVRALFFILQYLTVFMSHTTIAVSEKTKRQIAWMPFIRHKISVVHNGITQPSFLDKEKAREALGVSGNELVVGTIAELHKNKGLTYALSALSQLKKEFPEVRFVVIGEGEERETLLQKISELSLQKNVVLLGARDSASLFLPAFDIFILPSLTEALPYVLLEAGAAKLPVVATRVGGVPEIIEHEKTGLLVPPKDSSALAQSLRDMIHDTEKRRAFSAALHQRIVEKFLLEKMVKETLRIYKQ